MAKYDDLADIYHNTRMSGKAFYNEYYEVPAMLRLLPNLKGKNVLDLGCGSGIYTKIFLSKGAAVTGVDISRKMIEIAKTYAPEAKYLCQNMTKLTVPKSSFDIAVASLALQYLTNWKPALKAVYRSLKKGGFFFFSITNPLFEIADVFDRSGRHYSWIGHDTNFKKGKTVVHGDYFRQRWIVLKWRTERWGKPIGLRNYHRTLEYVINTCIAAGFVIKGVYEPRPVAAGAKISPVEYKIRSQLPNFMIFKLQKPN